MVARARAKNSPGGLHFLNVPHEVRVEVDAADMPVAFTDGSRHHVVARIRDAWAVNDGWWRGRDAEIDRTYVALTLRDGRDATLYYDRIKRVWYAQRY
jgi:hypothetical protein